MIVNKIGSRLTYLNIKYLICGHNLKKNFNNKCHIYTHKHLVIFNVVKIKFLKIENVLSSVTNSIFWLEKSGMCSIRFFRTNIIKRKILNIKVKNELPFLTKSIRDIKDFSKKLLSQANTKMYAGKYVNGNF